MNWTVVYVCNTSKIRPFFSSRLKPESDPNDPKNFKQNLYTRPKLQKPVWVFRRWFHIEVGSESDRVRSGRIGLSRSDFGSGLDRFLVDTGSVRLQFENRIKPLKYMHVDSHQHFFPQCFKSIENFDRQSGTQLCFLCEVFRNHV